MNCTACGAELHENDKFCGVCGAGVGDDENASSPTDRNAPDLVATAQPDTAAENSAVQDAFYEAALGYKNVAYYLPRFKSFDAAGPGSSWNWAAFFITFWWLLYRKMWGYAFLYMIAPIAINVISWLGGPILGAIFWLLYVVGVFVLIPMRANAFYYNLVRRRISDIRRKHDDDKALLVVASKGGTSAVALLVFVLFGVFVIGILAAIAIPAYQDFVVRARVVEGLSAAAPAKTAVAEHFAASGEACPSNEACGMPAPEAMGSAGVARITIGEGSVIQIEFQGAGIAGDTMLLTPEFGDDGLPFWSCRGGTIPAKYRPASCRGD